jgi:hypothetical protein
LYKPLIAAERGREDLFSAIDKGFHSKERRLLGQLFSDTALRSSESYVLNQTKIWTDVIDESIRRGSSKDGLEKVDLAKLSSAIPADILSDLCFGESTYVLTDKSNQWIPALIQEQLQAVYVV